MTTYVISARPGMPPGFAILEPDGVSQTPVPPDLVPPRVLEAAAWLSALAQGVPQPAGEPPSAVLAPTRPGGPYTALIEVDTP